MKTRAVRLYGKDDVRLEEMELPEIGDDGVRVKIISNSMCRSSYKAMKMGTENVRIPKDVNENPIILGHEFCGIIEEVGSRWEGKYKRGEKFAIQAAHLYQGSMSAPGFSYPYCGGDSQYANIPIETLLMDCLLPYQSDAYFCGSLLEPLSCIIRAFHAMYHTCEGTYEHTMGIKKSGKMALLAAAGPMGLGAVEYALSGDITPSVLVVTDIDDKKLARVELLFGEKAKKAGIELHLVNTKEMENAVFYLREITDGTGFDDVISFAPVRGVMEQADQILGHDGCLNVFAGPGNKEFSCEVNFFNLHYGHTHLLGTAGGTTEDMREAIRLIDQGRINPAVMVTDIGGLDCVAEALCHFPELKGAKKVIYPQIQMPLTAIEDFELKGKENPLFAELAKIVKKHNGLWCPEAEAYLLKHAEPTR